MSLPPLPEPLPHPVVDSHCHLDTAYEVSGLDPAEAIEQAASVGITRIVQIGCDLAGARFAVEAAERWDSVIAGVAIHPNDAARMRPDELPLALAEIEQLARHPRVRAVGETGLDHYRTRDEARADLFDYLERFHNPRMRRRVARRDRAFSALIKPSAGTG